MSIDTFLSFSNFKGIKRRFDIHISNENIVYIDDYAHHPKEIKAAIRSVIDSFPNRKLSVIFQPHLYSRTYNFYQDFAKALSLSDVSILLDIYPSREKPIKNVNSELIYNEMLKLGYDNILLNKDLSLIPTMIQDIHEDGDIIITMGAGDIYKQNNIIFEALS